MSTTWHNREAANADARKIVTARGEELVSRKPSAKGRLIRSLTEELAGVPAPKAVTHFHLRKKLGIPLEAEMLEVRRHWHRFSPPGVAKMAQTGDVLKYRNKDYKVVSAGQHSLILKEHTS